MRQEKEIKGIQIGKEEGTSQVVQWLRLHLPMQGVRVRSLLRELRSHMPRGQENQNIKQKQYCNKFNKDFKSGPHQKNKQTNKQNQNQSLATHKSKICKLKKKKNWKEVKLSLLQII